MAQDHLIFHTNDRVVTSTSLGNQEKWFDNDRWHISTNSTIDAFKAELNNVKYKNFGELAISAIKNMFNKEF